METKEEAKATVIEKKVEEPKEEVEVEEKPTPKKKITFSRKK